MNKDQIVKIMKDALMDLETSEGLFCNDGNKSDEFQINFKSIPDLQEAIKEMEKQNDSK